MLLSNIKSLEVEKYNSAFQCWLICYAQHCSLCLSEPVKPFGRVPPHQQNTSSPSITPLSQQSSLRHWNVSSQSTGCVGLSMCSPPGWIPALWRILTQQWAPPLSVFQPLVLEQRSGWLTGVTHTPLFLWTQYVDIWTYEHTGNHRWVWGQKSEKN